MSTALKPPRVREVKPAPSSVPVAAPPVPAAEPAPETANLPDCWGFKFWLWCAAILVLLHVIDWLGALFGS